LHYRAYAYLVKWLVESDVEWTREQLAQMLSFAETFRDHGVCRRNTTPDAFARAPFIRDFVGQLIYTTHIADMDENLVAVTQKDLDRGDSLQYHVNRIASLAIAVSSKTLDCISLISLLHTFCTLTFCGNTQVFSSSLDYLLPDDLQKVYRCAASVLINCVREKVSCGEDSVSLAVLLYDLYQYAERNNEKKLCVCLRKCLVIIAPHLDGFIAGSDPMEVTYLLLNCDWDPTELRSQEHASEKYELRPQGRASDKFELRPQKYAPDKGKGGGRNDLCHFEIKGAAVPNLDARDYHVAASLCSGYCCTSGGAP
uniref:DUF1741 domain-containing protein n=1 Tax=Toxocara canis TaxID=6265 RepID=A0A183TXM0_TOXCA